MSKTRRDLIVGALGKLQVEQAGQDIAPEDYEKVDGYVEAVFEALSTLDVLYVQNEDDIEARFYPSLIILLANAAANDFGGAYDASVDEREYAKLRRLQPTAYVYDPQRTDYF